MDQKIQNRVKKIQRLKEVGAPRWILALERLTLLHELGVLDDTEFDSLVEEQVTPLKDGKGYITVPEPA